MKFPKEIPKELLDLCKEVGMLEEDHSLAIENINRIYNYVVLNCTCTETVRFVSKEYKKLNKSLKNS